MKLENLTSLAHLHGIVPNETVQVVAANWMGPDALSLVYRRANGVVQEQMLFRADEAKLAEARAGRPWSLDADAANFRMVAEAFRIQLAHLFDPLMGVHMVVFVDGESAAQPHYLPSPFDREPGWAESSVNLDLNRLLGLGI